MHSEIQKIKQRITALILFFIFALLISGITAFPLKPEVNLLYKIVSSSFLADLFSGLTAWILHVNNGINATSEQYSFIFYGTDWLAFAHVVIAILFIGPLRNPIKNIWVIEFGIIACILVIPLALICGYIREIPFFWRLIDCSFGIFGIIPLLMIRRYIFKLENLTKNRT